MVMQNAVTQRLGKMAADPPQHGHKAVSEGLLSVLGAACCQSRPHCTESLGGHTAHEGDGFVMQS